MYFIVMMLSIHGQTIPMDNLANRHFRTHEDCFIEALGVADKVSKAGGHGQFMCMRRGESDAALDNERRGEF